MKLYKYLLYALLAISATIIVIFYVQSSSGDFALENIRAVLGSTTMVDGIIWWAYALVALSIVLVVILSLIGLANNKKSLKRAGLVLILTIIVCGISYALASGDPVAVNIEKLPSESTLKLTDTRDRKSVA